MARYEDVTELSEALSPDEEARQRVAKVKEEMSEAASFHENESRRFMAMSKEHSYAAAQFRIVATAGDPVKDDPTEGPDRTERKW